MIFSQNRLILTISKKYLNNKLKLKILKTDQDADPEMPNEIIAQDWNICKFN